MQSPPFTRLAVVVAFCLSCVLSQTWTSCNPLHTTCPANTALGMSIDVDFTKGSVNSFVASGVPSYDQDGVSLSVVSPGDAPQLMSTFYIMFGRVEVTMKAAPGRGIVSSVVLQSDDLDEIDFEWLGIDSDHVQTNYFGKGLTTSYNRGQFNPAASNQAEWHTYAIDWTQDRIVWAVDGTSIRTQTAETAEPNQYPQTPMQVKFGAWAGGDPSNAPGTIAWAGGTTDYTAGPYTMYVRSIAVTDYSTGKEYVYTDNSGTWQSIEAVGGAVNGNLNGQAPLTLTASAPTPTSAGGNANVPVGGIGKATGSATLTQTGWPWVATARPDSGSIPDGWVMRPDGKIVPAGATRSRTPSVFLLTSVVMGFLSFFGPLL